MDRDDQELPGVVVFGDGGIARALGARLVGSGRAVRHLSRKTQPAVDLTRADTLHAAARSLSDREWSGLVVAAGVAGFAPLGSLGSAHNGEVIEVNLTGVLDAVGAFVPHLTDGGFVLVVTGEIVEHRIMHTAAYTAAKAGLSAALDIYRRELRPRNLAVIEARPPHTQTGFSDRPLMGRPPKLPPGLDPDVVARRLLAGIEAREPLLRPESFS